MPFTHGAIIPLRGYAHVLRFAGSVRRRGVVWIEAAEDAKAAPAWPEGARVVDPQAAAPLRCRAKRSMRRAGCSTG